MNCFIFVKDQSVYPVEDGLEPRKKRKCGEIFVFVQMRDDDGSDSGAKMKMKSNGLIVSLGIFCFA